MDKVRLERYEASKAGRVSFFSFEVYCQIVYAVIVLNGHVLPS